VCFFFPPFFLLMLSVQNRGRAQCGLLAPLISPRRRRPAVPPHYCPCHTRLSPVSHSDLDLASVWSSSRSVSSPSALFGRAPCNRSFGWITSAAGVAVVALLVFIWKKISYKLLRVAQPASVGREGKAKSNRTN